MWTGLLKHVMVPLTDVSPEPGSVPPLAATAVLLVHQNSNNIPIIPEMKGLNVGHNSIIILFIFALVNSTM